MKHSYRIAHISDLHFGRIINWYNPLEGSEGAINRSIVALRAILNDEKIATQKKIFYPSSFDLNVAMELHKFLQKMAPKLNAILVTGDLATTGEGVDLSLASDFFHGRMRPEWLGQKEATNYPSLLQDIDLAVIALPGNHDRYFGVTKEPISAAFEDHFGKFWDFDRDYSYALDESPTNRVRLSTLEQESSCVMILSADFSLVDSHSGEGSWGYIGQGRVDPQTLNELVFATNHFRDIYQKDGVKFIPIWAVHFPPFFPNGKKELELIDSSELVEKAAACEVLIVVAGHTHLTKTYYASNPGSEGKVLVHCAGPSCGISKHENFSLTMLDITVDENENPTAELNSYAWDGEQFSESGKAVQKQNIGSLESNAPRLSYRERECLKLINAGRTVKEISEILIISEPTVKTHLSNIVKKLGIRNEP